MDRIHFPEQVWEDIIILESEGRFAMVDTGNPSSADRIVAYLRALGAKSLDFIILTHFHSDHFGACEGIAQQLPVARIYSKTYSGCDAVGDGGQTYADVDRARRIEEYAAMLQRLGAYASVCEITPQTAALTLGNMVLTLYNKDNIVWRLFNDPTENPYYHRYEFNENNNSCVVHVQTVHGGSALLCSDCYDEPLRYAPGAHMITQIAQALRAPVDVLKMVHHGCGDFITEQAARLLTPAYAVVSRDTADQALFAKLLQYAPGMQTIFCTGGTHIFTLDAPGQSTHTFLPHKM